MKEAFAELSTEAVQLYIGSQICTLDLATNSVPFTALSFYR